MKSKLNVGIIGCGGIAREKHVPSLLKTGKVKIYGLYDVHQSGANNMIRTLGLEDTKVYSSYQEMIGDEAIDVIHICTPNNSHCELSIAALQGGKHVMVEKPMAISSQEAISMAKTSECVKKKLSISYQNRFREDSQYLKRLCEAGELGHIYFAKAHATRRRAVPTWGVFFNKEIQGGGPLIDIGTHALDLTMWLMDNYDVAYVVGNTYNELKKKGSEANIWGNWDASEFEVEDAAFAMITMKNGATIMLESSWALNTLEHHEAKTTLCGTDGGADMLHGLRVNGEKFGKLYETYPLLDRKEMEFFDGIEENPADHEMAQWVDCIINDDEPLVTARQGVIVVKVLEAIYESAKLGKAIYFDDGVCG